MRRLALGIAASVAVILPVSAQAPWPGTPQRQSPGATSPAELYRYNALTPEDAYRQGLINRWDLERLDGPTPPALQGPSPNGSRGFAD